MSEVQVRVPFLLILRHLLQVRILFPLRKPMHQGLSSFLLRQRGLRMLKVCPALQRMLQWVQLHQLCWRVLLVPERLRQEVSLDPLDRPAEQSLSSPMSRPNLHVSGKQNLSRSMPRVLFKWRLLPQSLLFKLRVLDKLDDGMPNLLNWLWTYRFVVKLQNLVHCPWWKIDFGPQVWDSHANQSSIQHWFLV